MYCHRFECSSVNLCLFQVSMRKMAETQARIFAKSNNCLSDLPDLNRSDSCGRISHLLVTCFFLYDHSSCINLEHGEATDRKYMRNNSCGRWRHGHRCIFAFTLARYLPSAGSSFAVGSELNIWVRSDLVAIQNVAR